MKNNIIFLKIFKNYNFLGIFLIITFIFFRCQFYYEKKIYNYKELLEIFVHIEYMTKKDIRLLLSKYNLINKKRLFDYYESLKLFIKNTNEWNNFLKNSIDFFIKNINKPLIIKYYPLNAYDAETKRFNEDLQIDSNKLPDNFYKISYFIKNEKSFSIFEKSLYKNNKLSFVEYYDKYYSFLIKKELYNKILGKSSKYFFFNKLIN